VLNARHLGRASRILVTAVSLAASHYLRTVCD
jgi:hypothetical protein